MKKRKDITNNLDSISEKIRSTLTEKDSAREECLKNCREIIRLSSTAIRAVHRGENQKASSLISSASKLINRTKTELSNKHIDILHANYMHDSCKEYAEAVITYSIIFKRSIPDPDLLGIPYSAYLNGLAESIGELRRFILDSLRSNKYSQAEELLTIMDHIYTILVSMDFPDAITYGLRRNTDNARGIIERTRGDITLLSQNNILQQKLSLLERKIK